MAVALGAALVVPRIGTINQSLWNDEILTIQRYVSRGPAGIFEHYTPNDHMLFSLLAWLTVWLPHGPDWMSRVWAVVPFIAAVVGVAGWLWIRVGAIVAGAFAAFAVTSPTLLQLTTEARGYGLAFMCMGLLVVSAHEAAVSRSPRWAGAFCVASVLGAWTVPTFVLPAVGASAALVLTGRELRRILVPRLLVAAAAIAAWYAPILGDLLHSTGQQFGSRLPWDAPVTGGFSLFADAFVNGTFDSRAVVRLSACAAVAPLLLIGIRQARRLIPQFVVPTIALICGTLTVLTVSRMWLDSRFLSFLLVPIFIYAALGSGLLLRHAHERPAGFFYASLVLVVASGGFVLDAKSALSLPYENNRAAASAIVAADRGGKTPVISNLHSTAGIGYYLPSAIPLRTVAQNDLEHAICRHHPRGLVFVQQPYHVSTVKTGCLLRQGATVERVLQRARGGSISIWIVRPKGRSGARG